MSDYVVMVRNRASVYLAGPPLVKMATGEVADEESLGGAEMHSRVSGLSDYLAESEPDAIRIAREIISNFHLPKPPVEVAPVEEPIYSSDKLRGRQRYGGWIAPGILTAQSPFWWNDTSKAPGTLRFRFLVRLTATLRVHRVYVVSEDANRYWAGSHTFPRVSRYPSSKSRAPGESASSPMPGQVLRILTEPGSEVHIGAGRDIGPHSRQGASMNTVIPETKAEFPYFSQEHNMIRETVKRFAKTEIAPHAAEWDEAGDFPVELFKKGAELGLFGIRLDPEYGGSALDWWATAAYIEGMSYSDNGGVNMAFMVQSDITLPVLDELGTREQKEEFLKPAIAGDLIAALGISEPGGGSDVAAMKTRARVDGGDLVVSSQKLWITNGTRADFIILGVRTGEEVHKGISLVLVPAKTKGFSVGKKLKKIGNLSSDTAELFFDECRIPHRYVIGELNCGFYYIMHNFHGERLAAALGALAGMDRVIQYALDYGQERSAFGSPVRTFQVWRHKFAEHLTSIEAGRWLVYRAVDLMNRGQKCVREITMAKLYTSDLCQKVAYDCMQIFGGFGYTNEYPIGRFWRDVRLHTIGAGTSEIMKEILAKDFKI